MKHEARSKNGRASSVPAKMPNYQPIDDAPRVELRPGIWARYGLCPLRALQPNPHAVRTHSRRQLKKLGRSTEVSATLAPVICDERLVILAGHARVESAKLADQSDIPIVQVLGLTEAQKRQYLLADNRIALDGGWDRQKLAIELPELTVILNAEGYVLDDTGFEIGELDDIALSLEDDSGDPQDDIAKTIEEGSIVLKSGDLMQLGEHRLLVGDARDRAAIERLMAGELAAAAFLDPPYNVRISSIVGRGRIKHDEFDFASGEMSGAEFGVFLRSSLHNGARVSSRGAVHFVCMDWKHVRDLIEAGEEVYSAFLNLVVWNKTNGGQGSPYRSQHELICVFRVGGEPSLDNVQLGRFGRSRTNVWTFAGVNAFRAGRLDDLGAHPTVKPIQLVAEAIKDCTRKGEIVLDTFVGSGTTILAAERVGRRAYAMELKPKYATIAVRRWQALTGRDATLADTDLTFDELAQLRSGPPARVRTRARAG